MMFDEEQ